MRNWTYRCSSRPLMAFWCSWQARHALQLSMQVVWKASLGTQMNLYLMLRLYPSPSVCLAMMATYSDISVQMSDAEAACSYVRREQTAMGEHERSVLAKCRQNDDGGLTLTTCLCMRACCKDSMQLFRCGGSLQLPQPRAWLPWASMSAAFFQSMHKMMTKIWKSSRASMAVLGIKKMIS